MKKVVSMKPSNKEARLQELVEELSEFKMKFADLVDEYEEDGVEPNILDSLSEALAAIDDAIDGINDVVL